MDDFDEARIIDHLDPKRRALFEEFGGSVLKPDAEKYYLEYPNQMPVEGQTELKKSIVDVGQTIGGVNGCQESIEVEVRRLEPDSNGLFNGVAGKGGYNRELPANDQDT